MKEMIKMAAVMAALLAVTAGAQQYRWVSVGCTNNVPNNSTTTENLGSVINCTRYNEVALDLSFKLTGAGTTACTFKFLRSVDGTNYNAVAPIEIAIAPNGTTAVRTNLNVTMGAIGYLKLGSITAATNGQAMTNIVVGYAFKPNRRE